MDPRSKVNQELEDELEAKAFARLVDAISLSNSTKPKQDKRIEAEKRKASAAIKNKELEKDCSD